jgi:hypothetical protein
MTSGLWLANTIWGDLAVAHDNAFDWWLALSPNLGCDPARDRGCAAQVQARGRNDGLIYFDRHFANDGDQSLYLTKRYWVMAGFSRYVRPGDVVHNVAGLPEDVRALTFAEAGKPTPSRWTVVVINNSPGSSAEVRIALPQDRGRGEPSYSIADAVTTDAHQDLSPMTQGSSVEYRSGVLTATVSPASVSTFVLRAPATR